MLQWNAFGALGDQRIPFGLLSVGQYIRMTQRQLRPRAVQHVSQQPLGIHARCFHARGGERGGGAEHEQLLLQVGRLDDRFLGRFEEIACIDPDPLAAWLFVRRFKDHTVRWHKQDCFSADGTRLSLQHLGEVIARFDGHAVLFSNVLGKLSALYPEAVIYSRANAIETEDFSRWKRDLPELFNGRGWASYHDLFSGHLSPSALPDDALRSEWSQEALLEAAYGGHAVNSVVLVDHLCGGLAPDQPRHLFVWQRSRQHFHLVEAIAQPPVEPGGRTVQSANTTDTEQTM